MDTARRGRRQRLWLCAEHPHRDQINRAQILPETPTKFSASKYKPIPPLPPTPLRLLHPPLRLPPPPRDRFARLAAARPRAGTLAVAIAPGPAPNAARTADEVFRDYKARRAGMIKALTTGTPPLAPPIGPLDSVPASWIRAIDAVFSLVLCRCGEVLQAL
jgi:hypothetical protein